MSVQFGKCNFDDRPMDPVELEKVRRLLAPYGPDGQGEICNDNFAIFYCAFHTTSESRKVEQPFTSRSGAVITWDGRLDNREELIGIQSSVISSHSTDIEIVVAAYERWGTQSFARLVGDWAVSIWNPGDRTLVLAKDFMGVRQLYYSIEKDRVTWCTVLDPFVLFALRSLRLSEEYIAGWLGAYPAEHLTPYSGIYSVPPSSFVRLTRTTQTLSRYWDFDPCKKVRYTTDAEYEEHFRLAFSESVRRRLRSDTSVLAELSGGMDSSSIVCMADKLSSEGTEHLNAVDTISYHNESERDWNELPYFSRVEEKRGRTGCHLNVNSAEFPALTSNANYFAALPASALRSVETNGELARYMGSNGYRVLLSGIGGDEITGGVPTPIPELADLLASGSGTSLIRQLRIWALQKRTPWVHLLLQTIRRFVGFKTHHDIGAAQWLSPDFLKRNRTALLGYPSRLRFFGSRPSFQENLKTLDELRRQLACNALLPDFPHEKRYPYLDRPLMEFLFAIPREQLVRPGERRSLMRRALSGIVPPEILNRKRKAFAYRSVLDQIRSNWPEFVALNKQMEAAEIAVVEPGRFLTALKRGIQDGQISIVSVMRTLTLECWLKSLQTKGAAQTRASCRQRRSLVKVETSAS